MIKSFKILLCALLTAALIYSCCACSGSKSTQNSNTAQEENYLQSDRYNYTAIKQKRNSIYSSLNNILTKNKFSGTVYLKIGNDFEYLKSDGYANYEEHINNSINTSYYTGSVTKQFTAVAVLKLIEDKKLSIDDTLDKFFPNYKYGKKITVKNLLNMTSGIENYMYRSSHYDDSIYLCPEIESKISSKNSKSENKKVILDWIFSKKLRFNAGESYMFSDSNYYLLGEIIEKISGMSYEKFISKIIFQPLGMGTSGFKSTKNLAKSYYGFRPNDAVLCDGVGYSSYGLISNISDLLKWVDGLLDDEIISQKSLKEMFTPNEYGYGYGVFVGNGKISQWGRVEYYDSMLSYTMDKSEIFVSLTNRASSDSVYINNLFRNEMSSFLL